MVAAGAGHPEPGIPAPGCRLSMLKSRRLLRESGEEAAICIVVTICTAPARLGAVVLTSAWLEDGPHGARDHSVWQWLSLRWRRHCSEARPWRSLSGLVPKIRPKAATSATTAGRRRCRVRARTPTRVAGTPCGRVGVITKPTKAQPLESSRSTNVTRPRKTLGARSKIRSVFKVRLQNQSDGSSRATEGGAQGVPAEGPDPAEVAQHETFQF